MKLDQDHTYNRVKVLGVVRIYIAKVINNQSSFPFIMSERVFFSLRHTIPGFTFIALIVLTNLVPLFGILECLGKAKVESDIFFAVLSLLSGPPLGFLISQFWWFMFILIGADFQLDRKAFDALISKYDLPKPRCLQQKWKLIPVLDYIVHYEGDREEAIQKEGKGPSVKTVKTDKLFRYIERRWDLFHILCPEVLTLWIGFLFGISLRRILLFRHILWIEMETKIFVLIISVVTLLTFFLIVGIFWVRFQHDRLTTVFVNKTELEKKDLAKIFPNSFSTLEHSKTVKGESDNRRSET